MSNRNRISLTGADKFLLALEPERHLEGKTGPTCKYVIELKGALDIPSFIQQVRANEIAQWLAQFYLKKTQRGKSHWSQHTDKEISFSVFQNSSIEDQLYGCILNNNAAPLFHFDILTSKESTVLIFSWHHLLMDGYGAVLFLKNLTSPLKVQPVISQRFPFNRSRFAQMVKVKRFITRSSSIPFAVPTSVPIDRAIPNYFTIEFTQSETEKIEQNALKAGAKFGLGSYLLACIAQEISKSNSISDASKKLDLWVPVPNDMRKKGDTWPIIGNHLSFVYYRIPARSIADTEATVKAINDQLLYQIKNKLPEANSYLMHYLKRIPATTYRRLIKGRNRTSIASFLFTVAAEHPSNFRQFFDCTITNAYSFPPNTDPPGLVAAVNRFDGRLSIIVQSYEHVMKREELKSLSDALQFKFSN